MSSIALPPFNFRRKNPRLSGVPRLRPRVSVLGAAPDAPTGPSQLAPYYPGDPNTDPVEMLTDLDESCGPAPGKGRPDLPPWIYQPVNWENVDQINYALLPAIGSTAVIISYVVPPGRNGIINKVACNFVGGGWVEGSGDVVWRILVDGTPPPGATSYDSILASLGGPSQPTGIAGFRFFENQVLQFVAFNNPAGANGGVVVAGQRVGARFTGWNYPTDIEEDDIWI
jgi:hypothetical protein